MALIAALATALAALAAALAVGGARLGPLGIAPVIYGLTLVPAVVAVARGRRPPAAPRVDVPPAARRVLRLAVVVPVLVVMSAQRLPAATAGAVTTLAALAVTGLSVWWPLPSFLRVSLALAAVALLRPGTHPGDHFGALALMGASAAVGLVACNRLSTAARPALGGLRRRPRRRRVAGESAVVALALLLGALVASRMDAPRQPPSGQPRAGADPRLQQPAPLDYIDVLDPNAAGTGARGSHPDEVLLRVGAERAGVLRAVTFDEWDGRRWRRSDVLRGAGVVHRFVPVFSEGFEPFPGTLSEQRIRVEASYMGVAVGTPRVYTYELPGGADPGLDGTVRLVPALGRGAVYSAQTGRVSTTPDQLRAAGTGRVGTRAGGSGDGRGGGDGGDDGGGGPGAGRPDQLENPNLAAIPHVSERARALAERLTAGASTDYDKVTALSGYLAARVTIDAGAGPLAADADPIDTVLFNGRAASPERLATALAVLTRAVGIPSRLATGFLPGHRPFFGGDFVVRVRDAHTWVEVPFAGVGWLRFDPSGRIAAAERQDSLWSRLQRVWERYWPAFVLAFGLVVAFVVRRIVLRRRRLAAVPWATRYFARLAHLGARRGRARRPSETPAEYAAALAGGVLADERLVEVGRVVTAAAWSGRQPPEATRRWADQVLGEAARATRRTGRAGRARVRSGTGS